MDESKFKYLQTLDYENIKFHVYDLLRSNSQTKNDLARVVGISALAAMMKEQGDIELAMGHIEENVDDETTVGFLRKIKEQFHEQITEIENIFDYKHLLAAALFIEDRFTDVSTPEGIARLAISLLELNERDVVLDLGSGHGSFLTQAAYTSGTQKLYGVEINTESVIITNIRRLLCGLPITVIQGNILSQDFTHLSANKVFSNYPLGMRLSKLQQYIDKNAALKKVFAKAKRTVSADMVFNVAAYFNTKQPGKTVVLMTNAGTWNKPDEFLRRKLVEKGIVEGVILLPERLLSATNISLVMMVLGQSNQTVKMVDASEIFTAERRQNKLRAKDVEQIIEAYHNGTNINKRVALSAIKQQEYILNPLRHVDIDIGIKNGIELGEICLSINRGASTYSEELDALVSTKETKYRYLMLQNIQDGIIEQDLPYLNKIDDKYKKYCIGDKNLIVSRFAPFKIATAHLKKDELILASGNYYFIQLDEAKVNPIFVEVFLKSEPGIAQLNRFAKGSTTSSINISDLKRIIIPVLPRQQQDEIAKEYENLKEELLLLEQQIDIIRDKRAKVLEGVI